jgi:hypothetical protein
MPSQILVAGCVVPILSHLALPYEAGRFKERRNNGINEKSRDDV